MVKVTWSTVLSVASETKMMPKSALNARHLLKYRLCDVLGTSALGNGKENTTNVSVSRTLDQ